MLEKIISGGQTGADRAGLDVAIALGIPYGGYVTRGRRSEDGQVPELYKLIELDTYDYPTRTERNITESDATVLVTVDGLTGGSKLTASLAKQHKKPLLHIDTDKMGPNVAASKIREFLSNHPEIKTLNIAGSRDSKSPGFQKLANRILLKAIGPEDQP